MVIGRGASVGGNLTVMPAAVSTTVEEQLAIGIAHVGCVLAAHDLGGSSLKAFSAGVGRGATDTMPLAPPEGVVPPGRRT
jgi:hypothetical protein